MTDDKTSRADHDAQRRDVDRALEEFERFKDLSGRETTPVTADIEYIVLSASLRLSEILSYEEPLRFVISLVTEKQQDEADHEIRFDGDTVDLKLMRMPIGFYKLSEIDKLIATIHIACIAYLTSAVELLETEDQINIIEEAANMTADAMSVEGVNPSRVWN
jgi:hypothetical protein